MTLPREHQTCTLESTGFPVSRTPVPHPPVSGAMHLWFSGAWHLDSKIQSFYTWFLIQVRAEGCVWRLRNRDRESGQKSSWARTPKRSVWLSGNVGESLMEPVRPGAMHLS